MLTYRRKDGSTFEGEVSNVVFTDSSGRARTAMFIRDVTERQLAEAERERFLAEQLRARQRIEELAGISQRRAAELQGVLDSMVEGIIVADADSRISLANGAASEILGFPVDDLVGAEIAGLIEKLKVRHPDGQSFAAGELAIGAALDGEIVVGRREIVWNPSTRRDVIIRVGAAPIRSPGGQVTGAVIAIQDVTALTELDRLKDQFIAVAAHELKTPVTITKGYAQVLQQSADNLSADQRRMLDAIVRGANRIDRTIYELLDISRLSAGRLDLKVEEVDIAALVAESVDQAAAAAPRHLIRLVEAESAVVRADSDRIDQVIANLLDNAVRYSPQGGGVDVRVFASDHEAVVSIADRGVGIPTGQQSLVFQRFFRAHTDTPFDYGGMGTSLYISREIVQRHGGRIWFESAEGQGSTFCFSLPLASSTPTISAAALFPIAGH